MASKKDLVEAHAYNRRRLVTAFTSGAPGGREVEPSRPGKALVAGLVLGGLVVGAGAITGAVKPSVKDGWDDNSLVVARKTGARYLALKGNLFPVLNTASVRLVIPPEDFKVVFAPEDRIARAKQGAAIGIPGAPESVPRPQDLLQSKWTSCVRYAEQRDGQQDMLDKPRTSLQISRKITAEPLPLDAALVVKTAGAFNVLTNARRYKVTDSRVLSSLNLKADGAVDVPASWLNQFNDGGSIGPLTVEGAGVPLPASSGLGGTVRNGDVLLLDGKTPFLATPGGAYALSPVQFAMYRLGGAAAVKTVKTAPVPAQAVPKALVPAAAWPEAIPQAGSQYDTKALDVACVVMTTDPRLAPTTTLARPLAGFLDGTEKGALAVDGGAGALVTTGGPAAPVVLVDSLGVAYPLRSSLERVQLGYGSQAPHFVLDAWLKPLAPGVVLDRAAILEQSKAPAARREL